MLQVSLDLDSPYAQAALLQLQQAATSRRPSIAASLQTPTDTALGQQSAASLRQDSGAGPKTGLRQHSHASLRIGPGAAAETGAGQQMHASLRPATAETCTEYFARMEALAGQASEQTGVFYMADIRLTIGCVDALVCEMEFGQIAMEGRVPPNVD